MSGSAVQFSKAGVLMEPGPYHVHMSFQRRVTATFDRIQSTREWLLSSHRTKCIAGLVVAALVLIVLCVSLADWASSASSTSPSSTTLSQLVTTDATTTTTETSATTTTALVCGHDWVFYGEKCYQVLGRQTFAEAERDCETLSGTLASIHDLQQNLFLTKYVRTKYGEEVKFYIGLQRNWTGHFEWFDGSAYDFQAWQPNEPNAPHTEACVEVWTTYGQTTNGRWNDIGCDAHRYALCQKNVDADYLSLLHDLMAVRKGRSVYD